MVRLPARDLGRAGLPPAWLWSSGRTAARRPRPRGCQDPRNAPDPNPVYRLVARFRHLRVRNLRSPRRLRARPPAAWGQAPRRPQPAGGAGVPPASRACPEYARSPDTAAEGSRPPYPLV